MRRDRTLRETLDKSTLSRLYNDAGLSSTKIAQRYGAQAPAILRLMEEYGLPRRSRGGGAGKP